MNEKIREIYKDKSEYYIDILDNIKDNNIDFLMLNFIIPDDNPGDMDILINKYDKSHIENILIKNGFDFYTNIDSTQIVYNKFISNIGFIQFHLYVGIGFMNKTFIKGIPKLKGIHENINFSFLVFLLESFYRNKYKNYVFDDYIKQISILDFKNYVSLNFKNTQKIINVAYKCYNNNNKPKNNFKKKLVFNNYNLLNFYFLKIFKKIKRIGNHEDLHVLFIGVDGSGKTMLVSKLTKILSKGGVFTIPKYLGVKKSMIFKIVSFFKKSDLNSTPISKPALTKINKFDLLKNLQILFYWLEYNLRIFFQIKIFPNSAKSIILIDRSYLDLLFYHKNNYAKLLFLKYSFKPTHLVYLNGNSSDIYNRKREGSFDLHKNRILFYDELFNSILINNENKIQIDTVEYSPETCTNQLLDFFLVGK